MIEINVWLLITQAATFLAAMVIIWKLFWGPLTRFMRERSERLAADLKHAESGRREIEVLEANVRQRLSELEHRTQQALQDASAHGEQIKEQIVAEAHQEATVILDRAKVELTQERERVVRELRQQMTDLSLAALERLLGAGVDAKTQKQMLDHFIQDLENARPVA